MQQDFARADVTLANWRMAPFSRWSFQNVAEIVPTAAISHPSANKGPRPEAPDRLEIDDPGTGLSMSVSDYLGLMVRAILAAIHRLRAPPSCS